MENIYDGCPVCKVAGRKNFEAVRVPTRGAELIRCGSCGSLFCFTTGELAKFDQQDKEHDQ